MGKLAPRSCHLSAAGRTERQFKMESADINVKQKTKQNRKNIYLILKAICVARDAIISEELFR